MLGIVKSLWIEAIHRVSVTKANALGSLAPVFTLLIVWVFMHTPPTTAQMFSLAPILAGFFLLNSTSGKKMIRDIAANSHP
jgi:drug/metabolite transporter (DMT)-like permease